MPNRLKTYMDKNKNYNHIKKPKAGEILVVPSDPRLMEMPPYSNTVSKPPNWFRKIGRYPGSIRGCAGTQDYMNLGITLPFWTNAYLTPTDESENKWFVSVDQMPPLEENRQPLFNVQSFKFESTGVCPMTDQRKIEESCYPKLVNPWCFITAKGWSTLVLPILFEPNKNYDVVPAVVHTDFYHNINLVLNIKTDQEFKIEYGTPVFHLIPFQRKYGTPLLDFEDFSMHKMATSRGFNSGPVFTSSSSTASVYRKQKRIVDYNIEKDNSNKKWWRKQ